jgi:hypothetical protein
MDFRTVKSRLHPEAHQQQFKMSLASLATPKSCHHCRKAESVPTQHIEAASCKRCHGSRKSTRPLTTQMAPCLLYTTKPPADTSQDRNRTWRPQYPGSNHSHIFSHFANPNPHPDCLCLCFSRPQHCPSQAAASSSLRNLIKVKFPTPQSETPLSSSHPCHSSGHKKQQGSATQQHRKHKARPRCQCQTPFSPEWIRATHRHTLCHISTSCR